MNKTKPKLVPSLHEIEVDEIVEKGRKTVLSTKECIKQSKIITGATRKLIEESHRRGKKQKSPKSH